MSTLGTVLIVGGLLLTGFVAYKLFLAPDATAHRWGEAMRQGEIADPKAVGILQKAGIDLHKLEDTLDPRSKVHAKAMMGKYMSYF